MDGCGLRDTGNSRSWYSASVRVDTRRHTSPILSTTLSPFGNRTNPSASGAISRASTWIVDRLRSGTVAASAFNNNDLVVQNPDSFRETPIPEVVLNCDGAAGPGTVPDGDVQVEGRSAYDRRFVCTCVFPDGVCGAIACECFLWSCPGLEGWSSPP